ncbi:MAG: leucine--tRNA ligase [Candidatus Magasanikbacteria bacterium CG_4_10_14_0_2_um_filter_33_14]|uniref:Leucine--tRNA ligase n=1 Tax=Candidatus Magasanikbacteria bacterium CG_4_10_14_0_2_um_filter_33_14 TaxID=1974636 RepID=A0A2M7V989_9BACT|nr:MAG: leucine--tRNA ligase [Candidatus Magasanikbacteria bacterium CG_4_10_14_0_2_um_filter_33_14]
MDKYNPQDIEKKWQKYWEDNKSFSAQDSSDKPKFYPLVEFPYPSGAGLHVGHPRPYTGMDIVARKKRMEGFNVLYPIGFDAFGLPTENYAIKTGRPPAEVTAENIANFTRQIKSLGISFDWSRVVDTTDPKYYKWTQWIFLQLFKHGLAYKKNMPINWCTSCKIGLANEEVVDGKCERCGGEVEKRDKYQWMLAITKYADKLLSGLEDVDYIERAKVQQQNWIGKSEGASVEFKIKNSELKITVFTTRPDTLFGATYMVLSPEHVLVEKLKDKINNFADVEDYINKAKLKSDLERTELQKEKTGVELQGIKAINPVNNEEIPVFVADYVLSTYGTGAIMAVPAHDERDFEFAKKYKLKIKEVVARKIGEMLPNSRRRDGVASVLEREGKVCILLHRDNGEYRLPAGGFDSPEEDDYATLKREIKEETGYTQFTIADFLGSIYAYYYATTKSVNRERIQRGYVVHLDSYEQVPQQLTKFENYDVQWHEPEDALALLKQNEVESGEYVFVERYIENKKYQGYYNVGVNVNSEFLNGLETKEAKEKMITWLEEKNIGKKQINFKLRDWVFSRQRYWGEPIPLVYCEKCASENKGGNEQNPGWFAIAESELPLELPQVEKYEPTDTGESPLSQIPEWVKTTCPNCGGEAKRETDTMPNWAGSSWYFLRYIDPNNDNEFASQEKLKYWMSVDWYNGGMEHTVLHLLYSRFWNEFLYDIGVVPTSEPYKKRTSHGMILAKGGEKMSKSKGNVVNPDDVTAEFGADTLRTYIMFMGPFDQAAEWDTNGLVGVRRFLDRVWNLQEKIGESTDGDTTRVLHAVIKKVTDDIDNMRFNTAVAKLMELSNEVSKASSITKEDYLSVVKLISPFAPHMAEELWEMYGNSQSISQEKWPEYDETKIKEDTITIVVQVNGKVRDSIDVPAEIPEEEIKKQALELENVKKWLDGKEPKKVIYVKGRLVSVVV